MIAICMAPSFFEWRPGAGNSEDVPKMMLYAWFSHVRLEMFLSCESVAYAFDRYLHGSSSI